MENLSWGNQECEEKVLDDSVTLVDYVMFSKLKDLLKYAPYNPEGVKKILRKYDIEGILEKNGIKVEDKNLGKLLEDLRVLVAMKRRKFPWYSLEGIEISDMPGLKEILEENKEETVGFMLSNCEDKELKEALSRFPIDLPVRDIKNNRYSYPKHIYNEYIVEVYDAIGFAIKCWDMKGKIIRYEDWEMGDIRLRTIVFPIVVPGVHQVLSQITYEGIIENVNRIVGNGDKIRTEAFEIACSLCDAIDTDQNGRAHV